MSLNRRTVLKFGLGGAAWRALGGVGLALQSSASRPSMGPLEVLSAREYAILTTLAEALCPGGEGLPTVAEVDVAGKVDLLLSRMHPAAAAEFQQVLGLIESPLAGLFLQGQLRPFSQCDLAERTRILKGWKSSTLSLRRTVYKAISGLVISSYWSDPRTYAFVGYKGPPPWADARRKHEAGL